MASIDRGRAGNLHTAGRAILVLATLGLTLVLGVPGASATPKQAIAYFGTEAGSGSLAGQFNEPHGIAVNSSGAGPADKGDIYVIDSGNNRIQRFAQDDNGTPANPYDDTYPFISAWGAGVDSAVGGTNYEICVAAVNCQAAAGTGGNGTAAGNGALNHPEGIAVDQDTGDVYVTDSNSFRVNAYSGVGAFLRSFGFDVVESGPDNTGTGFEVCVASNGDICKQGVPGAGVGQIGSFSTQVSIAVSPPDGNPATGTVFLADGPNFRVNTYNLSGSSPSSFGSVANFGNNYSPTVVAVDSRGIVYAASFANGGEIERYDSQNANGGGVGFLAPIPAPPLSTTNIQPKGLEVDPDSDGAGPETDTLYVLRDGDSGTTVVQQFGPLNKPGLTAPPVADDEEHGAVAGFNFVGGLGLDESSGRLFVSDQYNIGGPWAGFGSRTDGVYVLDKAGGIATASLESLSGITATSVVLHGKVNPNGPPDASYRAEYSLDGTHWTTDPGTSTVLGSQESAQSVTPTVDPPGGGLEPNTLYHVRLVATRPFNPPVVSNELTFTTALAPPLAETTGTPLRTTTTAQLAGRVDPSNSPATFHFEYGDEGPCDANPCTATETVSAGSGGVYALASQSIGGLEPNTTYHYRIVADNGNPGSPVFGEDATVTTRASDAPLSHGHLPGPPGSDRAYEQVNLPDTGGNPVGEGNAFSDNGDRAVYTTHGGNPSSPVGSLSSQFFAERVETAPHIGGWESVSVSPPRDELAGSLFLAPSGPSDLSSFTVENQTTGTGTRTNLWRLSPDAAPERLFEPVAPQEYSRFFVGSDDSTRVVARLRGGTLDPLYPTATAVDNFYDLSAGTPKLASLLPGNTVSPCAVAGGQQAFRMEGEVGMNPRNWLSADGKLFFFPGGCGTPNLYMREFEAEQTKLISGPPLSGNDCGAIMLTSTADAAFFWTQTRLAADDTNPVSCEGGIKATDGDVYRYDIATAALKCVTCVVAGIDADVYPGKSDDTIGAPSNIAVAEDGSRVYFQSPNRLLPGAPALPPGATGGSVYRVDVAGGNLRWIAGPGADAGAMAETGTAITRDGSAIIFLAKDPSLNPLGEGTDNGGTLQYYRYDDTDHSLICVSCPPDGATPKRDLSARLFGEAPVGANTTPLAADGTFAFATTEALVNADQNTDRTGQHPVSGTDLYEWRDGRLLPITDGLTNWPGTGPQLNGVDPSGRDVFFTADTQYTQDALDGYRRLYDARIGGGFEFPPPPKPCPLEVCQGTPRGAPEEQPAGTSNFAGPGNSHPRAHHKKHKKRHQKKQRRANHNRRSAR